MKVLHLNTLDVSGGAARSAYRLHQGLLTIGVDSKMLVRVKSSDDDTVYSIQTSDAQSCKKITIHDVIHSGLIAPHTTTAANTLFSIPTLSYDITNADIVANADIINLHWVANYLSPLTISKLGALGKQIVWTLHDQWPFTGGCHYSNACTRYETTCTACPQLDLDIEIAAAVLDEKATLFQPIPLTIVTPSSWMYAVARESKLFKDKRIEHISYSLNTEQYINIPKHCAKKTLGIDPHVVTILFAAQSLYERRKGYQEFISVLRCCENDDLFKRMIQEDRIKLIVFGQAGSELLNIGVPVLSLGVIDSDEAISTAYSAADLYIMTSLEDNLPNTILESMSCGTPVLAFSVGGIPDMVKSGITGDLITPFDIDAMTTRLLYLLNHPELLQQMGTSCRQYAEKQYAFTIQADRYKQLYTELLPNFSTKADSDHTHQPDVAERLGDTFPLTVEKDFGEPFSRIYPQILEEVVLSMIAGHPYERNSMVAKIDELSAELIGIKQSKTWKSTAWIRKMFDIIQAIHHRLPK